MHRPAARIVLTLAFLAAAGGAGAASETPVVIGSKRFTESYLLGEIAREALVRAGVAATHRQGLGNTAVLFEALKTGAIDAYPDYTGTIARELLKTDATDIDALDRALVPLGLGVAVPLGFENTYALAMRDMVADREGVATIGDLARNATLRIGLSPEFLHRADGWPGLARAYSLPQAPAVLDHGLAYEALAAGRIDVMDIYSTDAKITRLKLRVLADPKRYFPEYQAVFVHRLDLPARNPAAWAALRSLAGRIDARTMIAMNAEAELDHRDFGDIARRFLDAAPKATGAGQGLWARLFADDLSRLTGQHLLLVFG